MENFQSGRMHSNRSSICKCFDVLFLAGSQHGLDLQRGRMDAPNGVDHVNASGELLIRFGLNDDDGQSANASPRVESTTY